MADPAVALRSPLGAQPRATDPSMGRWQGRLRRGPHCPPSDRRSLGVHPRAAALSAPLVCRASRRALAVALWDVAAVVPVGPDGPEAVCAAYSPAAIPVFESQIARG